MARLRLTPPLLALAAALSLSSCGSDAPKAADDAKLTGAALCAEAFAKQVPAADFTPANPADAKPGVSSLLGIGTVEDGFCLDTATEFYGKPWEISAITVTAVPDNDEVLPTSYSRTTTQDGESLPFFVPAEGCTKITGVLTVMHPVTSEVHTWFAEAHYTPAGEKC